MTTRMNGKDEKIVKDWILAHDFSKDEMRKKALKNRLLAQLSVQNMSDDDLQYVAGGVGANEATKDDKGKV